MVLIWQLSQHRNLTHNQEERIERQATKFVAMTFLILAGYILFEAVRKLGSQEIPQPSVSGIFIATASTIIIPELAGLKIKIGKQLNRKALIADAKETLVCASLSVALLLGLGCNYFFGFWQADPLVAGVIVCY